ncbi:MAG: hypothetical protein KGS61_18960, partial [Verrucomicrobia bacterium]|nr:hypothetical protein [Verrucomicrobiota bacterium]
MKTTEYAECAVQRPKPGVRRAKGRGEDGRMVLGLLAIAALASLARVTAAENQPLATSDLSLRHEVQHAVDLGLAWLRANQNTNGFWSTADHPAVTALALTAFAGDPSGRFRQI